MTNENFERIAVALGVEEMTRQRAEAIIKLLDDKQKTFEVDWDGIRMMALEIINVVDYHREWKGKKAAETYQKARANHDGRADVHF